jgi:hypothetical protein
MVPGGNRKRYVGMPSCEGGFTAIPASRPFESSEPWFDIALFRLCKTIHNFFGRLNNRLHRFTGDLPSRIYEVRRNYDDPSSLYPRHSFALSVP